MVAPGASFAGAYGAGAGFRTAGFMGVSLYPPGSDDKEWDNSKPTYVRTITLKDWGTNRGKPVESVQPEQIEHKPAVSGFGDRLMRIVRPVHEPFEPSDFVVPRASVEEHDHDIMNLVLPVSAAGSMWCSVEQVGKQSFLVGLR